MGDGFGDSVCKAIKQAKTVEERALAARLLIEEFGFRLPLVLDSMDDSFERGYASWPLRFYLVQNGQVVYKAMPTSTYRYSLQEVEVAIQCALN